MHLNRNNQSVWQRPHVRLASVLMVICSVIFLAFIIKFVILPSHSEHDIDEVLNNDTMRDYGSNRSTIEASTTRSSIQVTSSSEDPQSHISSISVPNRWSIDSHLILPRSGFSAAIMKNDEILVSGGFNSEHDEELSCEIYSSLNRKWWIAADMQAERGAHTLTVLQNGTDILAIGGANDIDSYTGEIYELKTKRWTFTPNIMDFGPSYHTATLLQNGQVLIVGGYDRLASRYIAKTRLYDPLLNTFIKTGDLSIGRLNHTATLLEDGLSVLITGGHYENTRKRKQIISTAEVYTNGSWSNTNGGMINARGNHAAVLLLDGNVLVAGGSGINNSLSSVEIYNATTHTFSITGYMACARSGLTLTLLPSGQVLATGGIGSTSDKCPVVSELYDPTTGQWMSARLLNTARYGHVTVLINNSVLAIGGYNNMNIALRQCERYDL